MKMLNKIKRWLLLRFYFLDWNLDIKLIFCFYFFVVNIEREMNVWYVLKFFFCEWYFIFRDVYLLLYFVGEIKLVIFKVELLVMGSDLFLVFVKLIEEEVLVIWYMLMWNKIFSDDSMLCVFKCNFKIFLCKFINS